MVIKPIQKVIYEFCNSFITVRNISKFIRTIITHTVPKVQYIRHCFHIILRQWKLFCELPDIFFQPVCINFSCSTSRTRKDIRSYNIQTNRQQTSRTSINNRKIIVVYDCLTYVIITVRIRISQLFSINMDF